MSTIAEILKQLAGKGSVIHTHSSLVYITTDFVYKVKLPVYYGFLDYRDLKKRRACCLLEVELNSRYSEDVYLEVLKIVKKPAANPEAGEPLAGGFAFEPITSSLPAVEYVVKMRRIPDELFLSNRLNHLDTTDFERIGGEIAKRLERAESSENVVEERKPFELIAFNIRENFDQLRAADTSLFELRLNFVEKISNEFLKENEELINSRSHQGFIKNGHGDLRLEHVFEDNNKLSLIDCIEFNKRFRTNDVVSEAAFLSMELDYAGRLDLSDAFIRGFLNVFSDAASLKLLNFYRCYRAMVRAKVSVLAYNSMPPLSEAYFEKRGETERLINMAFIYALSMKSIFPLVFCGMIATGKSTYAGAFIKNFPVERFSTDKTRKELNGIAPEKSVVLPAGEGIYSEEVSLALYRYLGEKARHLAEAGRIALIDGTFIKRVFREAFEKEVIEKPLYITFNSDEEAIKSRLAARESGVTDGRLSHFDALYPYITELPQENIFPTDDERQANLDRLLCLILKYHI